MVDIIFECELALELRMTVGELRSRMSLHELCVVWPAYFAYRSRRHAGEQAEIARRSQKIIQ